MWRLAAVLLILLAACTQTERGAVPRAPSPVESPAGGDSTPLRIGLAIGQLPHEALQRPYYEAIEWAVREVNARGGVAGRPIRLVRVAFDRGYGLPLVENADVRAVLVAASPWLVTTFRNFIERSKIPVIAVGGDLYTGRHLYRYAFQTAIPVRWQARVLARYLVVDRGYSQIAVAARSREEAAAFRDALAEEGAAPAFVTTPFDSKIDGGGLPQEVAGQATDMDAMIVSADPVSASLLSSHLSRSERGPQLVIAGDIPHPITTEIGRDGSVFVASYTWAAWAAMLPRVQDFRDAFAAEFGRFPAGPEQEGYDAVMALAESLERTDGRGGDALVRALEGFRDETYSSTPVRLGPDDHVLAEESHLGLFAVTDPAGAPEGEAFGDVPWRPIMRTFTTDGEKVNLLDRDKRIFFPFWRPKRPTPVYRRSEFGIVTRPSDPLH